jgi:hypothetical protein
MKIEIKSLFSDTWHEIEYQSALEHATKRWYNVKRNPSMTETEKLDFVNKRLRGVYFLAKDL